MSLRERDVFPDQSEPAKRKRQISRRDRESAVLRECMMWLRRHGALVIRANTGLVLLANGNWMHSGTPGWPDICGVLPDGRFIGVECKARRGGRQSVHQKRIEQEISKRNGIYVLASSAEDVRMGIERATRNR